MKNPKDIQIKDYSYELPDERIAKFPLRKRDESKLFVYNRGEITSDIFKNITTVLVSTELALAYELFFFTVKLMIIARKKAKNCG